MTPSNLTTEQLLATAYQYTEELRSRLRTSLSADEVSPIAKIPYKLCILREVLLHRTWDLSDAACDQFKQGRTIPAFVLVRAAFEAASAMFYLHKKVKQVVDTRQLGDLDEAVVMKGLFGRKGDGASPYEAVNVLTLIKHLDLYVADGIPDREGTVSKHFAGLCEFAHPNWEGCMGAYCRDVDDRHTEFGSHLGLVPPQIGLHSLRLAVSVAAGFSDKLAELDSSVRQICEDDMKRGTT